MSAFLATIAAVIPNVFIGIVSKLVTEKFLQSVLEKVIVYGLKKAADITTNTVDDELVEDVEQRFKEGAGA